MNRENTDMDSKVIDSVKGQSGPTGAPVAAPAELTVEMQVTFAGYVGTVAEVRGAHAFVAWHGRPSSWHSIFDLAVVR